ncbi:MAG TPA: hypothetical protein VKE51_43230 [Vicinamibacterales bacterium]|nr:hypothetical protein [Vicinamibacterales bacterium]
MNRTLIGLLAIIPLTAATACTTSKSANPLSPEVAGPIPGVQISAPKTLEPSSGVKIPVDQQPLTLLAENAGTTGVRPLSYVFQIAADAGFTNIVFSREGVEPGDGGRTSLRLPDRLAPERSYFWRVKAQDGANTGPFSTAAGFDVFTPIVIEPPDLVSPAFNQVDTPLRPTFVVNNAVRSGPVGAITYMFELSDTNTFANKVFQEVPEQPNQTSVTPGSDLGYATVYYWHVRAFDSRTLGPWSPTRAFQTMAQPVAPPPPPGGGGGGGGGNWEACGSTPGYDLVACVHAAVNPSHTVEGAFEVTKRVAWLLRGSGAGLLIKNGGENIVSWRGYSFAAGRICYPDGHIWKVLSDVPGTNGPSWQDNDFVDRSLYVPAIDPR